MCLFIRFSLFFVFVSVVHRACKSRSGWNSCQWRVKSITYSKLWCLSIVTYALKVWPTSKSWERASSPPSVIAPVPYGKAVERVKCSTCCCVCLASGRSIVRCAASGRWCGAALACPWTNSSWKCSSPRWDKHQSSFADSRFSFSRELVPHRDLYSLSSLSPSPRFFFFSSLFLFFFKFCFSILISLPLSQGLFISSHIQSTVIIF